MSDEHFYSYRPPLRRMAKLGELLWELVRPSDHAHVACYLRFNTETYGWEVQLSQRGEFWFSHHAFDVRADAIAWAARQRTSTGEGRNLNERHS